jgi:EAL domain-containing protein (putative c-di-GMP-specific phosphodiesterase class I)
VDRSFVTGLATNPRQQELVSAVLQLGHTLGLKVMAEGVETEAQLRVPARIGCQFAQGYTPGGPRRLRIFCLSGSGTPSVQSHR